MRLPASADFGGENWSQPIILADAPVELAHYTANERPIDIWMNDGTFLPWVLRPYRRYREQCGTLYATFIVGAP